MNKNKNKNFFKAIKKSVMGLTFAGMMALSTILSGCAITPGEDGKNGSMWYRGVDIAQYRNKGVDGDFFFDSDDKILYQKILGVWEPVSDIKNHIGSTPSISINADGYWVIDGEVTEYVSTGAQGNTPYIGDNGNWWIDEQDTSKPAKGLQGKSAFDLYKEQNPNFDGDLNDWLESLRVKGDQGVQGDPGATWLTGSENPENTDGKNGDTYLNTTTFDIFKKVDGVWSVVGNIKGDKGSNGYDRDLMTVSSEANIPLFLNDKGVALHDINLADNQQKITFYGANRLDIDTAKFSHESTVSITKENNGITVETGDSETVMNGLTVHFEYTAEFSGTLWLSCDAELARLEDGSLGNVLDVGMRMNENCGKDENGNTIWDKQHLCRGVGRLAECMEVEKGDKIRLVFYVKIGTTAANKIMYKNIMLQYGNLTDYVPYMEDKSNFYVDTNTTETVFVDLPNLKNYSTGCIIESEGDFTVDYSYLEQKKTLKIVNFGDSITGLATNDVAYSSVISRTSDYEAYNVGFSGTTYEDHGISGSSKYYNHFALNRLVDAICSDGENKFEEQWKAMSGITKEEYPTRLKTLESIDFTQIDYVTIFYGYNDWNYGHILTSEEDGATENKQNTNLEDAMKYSINKLKAKFPELKIIVLTPYRCAPKVNDQHVDVDTKTNARGELLSDCVDVIKDVAESLDVEDVIDLYQMTDFVNVSNFGYYMADGVHPNNTMNQILAQIIINKITELENK